MKLTKRFFKKMVNLFFICALYDQKMSIACLLCMQLLCGDHTHSVCAEHDVDVAHRHITCKYVDFEVRLAHVVW
jgi:hypothetical protein